MRVSWISWTISVTVLSQCLRPVHGTDSKNDCVDKPSWCHDGLKHFCHDLPLMKERCPRLCGECFQQNASDCSTLQCEHFCQASTNSEPECRCDDGYKLLADGRSCEDIDECKTGYACKSDYKCINTVGSFYCEVKCKEDEAKYYGRSSCCKLPKAAGYESCGLNSENGGPTGNEEQAMLARWPWMALIYVDSMTRDCAGVLISNQWVLTAAHCFNRQIVASEVTLLFGIVSDDKDLQMNEHIQERSAEKILIHPDYDHPHNDVALIKLSTRVELNDHVRTNCLPREENPRSEQNCWAVGYAARPKAPHVWRTMQQITVTIDSDNSCLKSSDADDRLKCLTYSNRTSPTDCQGSTGGPIVCQRCSSCEWYTAGMISDRFSCAEDRERSAFTSVSMHENWITKIVGLAGFRSIPEPPCIPPPRTISFWGEWEPWSDCSTSCGDGISSRKRKCFLRQTGDCEGDNQEIRLCHLTLCRTTSTKPTPTQSTEWGEWSKCSSSCGGGTRKRYRPCRILEGRRSCNGKEKDVEKCNSRKCPDWGKWTEWDPCSVTCGRGKQRSTRVCMDGKIGDKGCVGRSARTKTCRRKICPEWSTWGKWSECSQSCGGGYMSSSRTCRLRNKDIRGCLGNGTRTMSCNENECEGCGEWTSWSTCSVSCGSGSQHRNRKCSHGTNLITRNQRKCVQRSCKSHWTDWSDWSQCDASCGNGEQLRQRQCIGEEPCEGSDAESKECNAKRCPAEWSNWGSWSSCDTTCGVGLETRRRKCPDDTCDGSEVEQKLCRNENCQEPNLCESYVNHARGCEEVYARYCGVYDWVNANCGKTCCRAAHKRAYGEWSTWSRCTHSCGGGMQQRKRECNIPNFCASFGNSLSQRRECNSVNCGARSSSPVCSATCGGGIFQRRCSPPDCPDGQAFITEFCNTHPCPNVLHQWSDWSECTVSCGSGTRERSRNCTGSSCESEILLEVESCEGGDCVSGRWSDWEEWGTCSSSCGPGTLSRKRTCLDDHCEGKSVEEKLCLPSDCPSEAETTTCEDSPEMQILCPYFVGYCKNGYMKFACRKTCNLC